MARPIGIDLFAGAGGLSLGFEQAGFDIAAAIEIDPIHCATHAYNFPYSKTLCASVADLRGDDIRAAANIGNADIAAVFGGAPCQGFSMIGKRNFDDPRNHLIFHYVRLVRELQPKYCVFENVKGLTVGQHVEFLEELVAALHAAGYDVVLPYRVLNAADFGVPQDRRRLFLLGVQRGLPAPRYPDPLPDRPTVWGAIGDLPDADRFATLQTSDTVVATWETTAPYARRLRGLDRDPDDLGYARAFDRDLLTCSRRTRHTLQSQQRFCETPPGKIEPISRFFKLDPDGLCNTLRAGTDSARGAFTSPRPIHPYLPRVITVREMARLHSYPDWFRLHGTKWHGARQIGNSVPPLLARAIAREIIRVLGIAPTKPHQTLTLDRTPLLTLGMKAAARYFGVSHTTIPPRRRNAPPSSTPHKEAAYA